MRSRLIESSIPGRKYDRASVVLSVMRRVHGTLPLACHTGLFGQFAVILKFENSRAVHFRISFIHRGKRTTGRIDAGRQRRSLARIERAVSSLFDLLPRAEFFGALRLNFEHTNGAVYYKDTEYETGFSVD